MGSKVARAFIGCAWRQLISKPELPKGSHGKECARLPDAMVPAGTNDLRSASSVDQYIAALHFAMTTMATVGVLPDALCPHPATLVTLWKGCSPLIPPSFRPEVCALELASCQAVSNIGPLHYNKADPFGRRVLQVSNL